MSRQKKKKQSPTSDPSAKCTVTVTVAECAGNNGCEERNLSLSMSGTEAMGKILTALGFTNSSDSGQQQHSDRPDRDFISDERDAGLRRIAGMAETYRSLWRCANAYGEGGEMTEGRCDFATFSEGNPFVGFLDRSASEFFEALRNFTALGYVAVSTSNSNPRARLDKPRAKRRRSSSTT